MKKENSTIVLTDEEITLLATAHDLLERIEELLCEDDETDYQFDRDKALDDLIEARSKMSEAITPIIGEAAWCDVSTIYYPRESDC